MRALVMSVVLWSIGAAAAPLPSMRIEACGEHLPYGLPQPAATESRLICRFGYALEHDNLRKVPLWAAYTITPSRVLGCYPRTSGFSAEPSLPKGRRAELSDYTNSGYDRGHLVPNSDARWHMQVEDDTNVLSNAAPMDINLNRGAWKVLEDRVRVFVVERRSTMLIYAGPIFGPEDKAIGLGAVTVPSAFYKVIIDQRTRQVLAFIYPNAPIDAGRSTDLESFRVPYAEVVRQVGWVLPLPRDAVMSRAVWTTVEKTVADAKDCPIQ